MPLAFRQIILLIFLAAPLGATDIWSGLSFSIDPAALRQAADAVKPVKHKEATVLLNDVRFTYDEAGRSAETNHLIYRIENQEGVQNWAEVSGASMTGTNWSRRAEQSTRTNSHTPARRPGLPPIVDDSKKRARSSSPSSTKARQEAKISTCTRGSPWLFPLLSIRKRSTLRFVPQI
jgi:hypothetical protein